MEQTIKHKETKYFSLPLLKQSIKSNWVMWLFSTFLLIVLIFVINIISGRFSSAGDDVNQAALLPYIAALQAQGLTLEGLFDAFGLPTIYNLIMNADAHGNNSVLITMFYTVVGFVLPMIYVLNVSNKLIADQVDKGSLAFVLATPIKRSAVMITQAVFLIGSTFLMILVNFGADVISTSIAGVEVDYLNKIIMNLGLFLTIISIAGIAFLASCIFNLSKHAVGISGGLAVIFYLSSILAMFGQDRFVEIGMGNDSMKVFQYFSIITLYDTESIGLLGTSNVDYGFIWQFGVLFVIATACFIAGSIVFKKKDLPL